MSYMQRRFCQNKCQLCPKTFCCEKCRQAHENGVHQVFPGCSICIYGMILFSSMTTILLEHIRQRHWPLHCVLCKKVFVSTSELTRHNHCPIGSHQEPISQTKTPLRHMPIVVIEKDGSENYCSPPVGMVLSNQCINLIATTSTPLQAGEVMLEGFPATITPVDMNDRMNKLNYANENLSAHTPHIIEDQKKSENTYKRRVTFSETPQTEREDEITDSGGKKCEPHQLYLRAETTPTETGSFDKTDVNYVTADSEVIHECEDKENDVVKPAPAKKRRSSEINETMWKSAINETLELADQTQEPVKETANADDSIFKEGVQNCKVPDDSSKITEGSHQSMTCDSHFSFAEHASGCARNILSEYSDGSEKTPGIWSSMAFFMKTVVQGFSKGGGSKGNSMKRHLSDSESTDMELVKFKKIKLTEIKCRPPIRHIRYIRQPARKSVKKVDKSTQTDES